MRRALSILLAALSVAACTSNTGTETTQEPPPESSSTTTVIDSPITTTATPTTAGPATTVAPAAAPSLPSDLEPTPAQTEGPFYPVTKPEDRDNDLLSVDGSTEPPDGTPLELFGLLVDTSGNPIVDATIEIWQVDNQGIYDHPGDAGTEQRDRRFQFYGETLSDAAGAWSFLTLQPVPYEPRPAHIHVKVLVDGSEVLTSQIYFADDPLVASDGIAAGTDGLDRLIVTPVPATLSNGMEGVAATHVIVIG